jgi:hypothetical protein
MVRDMVEAVVILPGHFREVEATVGMEVMVATEVMGMEAVDMVTEGTGGGGAASDGGWDWV